MSLLSQPQHWVQRRTIRSTPVDPICCKHPPTCQRRRLVAQIVVASEGLISVPKATREVGVDTPSRKNNTISKREHRAAKGLVIVDEKTVSFFATVVASTGSNRVSTVVAASIEHSSASSLSNPPSNTTTRNARQTVGTPEAIRRSLPISDPPPKKANYQTIEPRWRGQDVS